jgi:hypothetical protein
METKLSKLKAAMAAGDWRGALAIAARFPQLGEHRAAILDGHTAYTNPRWLLCLHRDVEQVKQAGIAALIARYP